MLKKEMLIHCFKQGDLRKKLRGEPKPKVFLFKRVIRKNKSRVNQDKKFANGITRES